MRPEIRRAQERFRKAKFNLGAHRKDPRSSKALRAFHLFLVEAEALLLRQTAAVACTYGCTNCCYKIPLVYSEMESLYLQKAVLEEAGAIRKIMDRVEEADTVWKKLVAEFGLRSSHESYSLRAAWEDLGVPCPLLQGEACLIYKKRPLECRLEMNVFKCQRGAKKVWPLFPHGPTKTLGEALSKIDLINDYVEGVLPAWETGVGLRPMDEMRILLRGLDVELLGRPGPAPFPITTIIGRSLPAKSSFAGRPSSIPSAWTSG